MKRGRDHKAPRLTEERWLLGRNSKFPSGMQPLSNGSSPIHIQSTGLGGRRGEEENIKYQLTKGKWQDTWGRMERKIGDRLNKNIIFMNEIFQLKSNNGQMGPQ